MAGQQTTYLLVVVVVVSSSGGAGFERLDLGGDVLETLVVGKPGGFVLLRLGRPVLCLFCWLEGGIFPDSSICVRVDLLDVGRSDVVGEVCRELLLESECTREVEKGNGFGYLSPLVIFFLQALHVLSDVTTEDILLQHLGIQLFGFWVITWETLLIVGNVETAVTSTLESTEHT